MPVERLRLRPWLEQQIDQGKIPGLVWINREKKIFRVAWKHASRQGWKLEYDASLFRAWAIHTGKYRIGKDAPIPKTWKANFRCALNALPDIEEIRSDGKTKGLDAYKVYKMLPKDSKTNKPKKNPTRSGRGHKKAPSCKPLDNNAREDILNSAYLSPVGSPMAVPIVSPVSSQFNSPFNTPPYSIGSPVSPTSPSSPSSPSWSGLCTLTDPLRDHDYPVSMGVRYRGLYKDNGLGTYADIKQEPSDIVSTTNSPILEMDDGFRDFPDLSGEVKQEVLVGDDSSVPTDQEIVNLVDEMSNTSDSFYSSDSDRSFGAVSPTYSSSSALSYALDAPMSPPPNRPTSFPFPLRDHASSMAMHCTLTMTPECSRDLMQRLGLAMANSIVN